MLSNPIYVGGLRHKGQTSRGLARRDRRPRDLGPCPTPACGTNATKGGSPSECRVLSRRQTLRRSGQSDGPKPCRQRRAALALLYFTSDPHGSQTRRRIVTRVPAAQIEKQVFDATKSVIVPRRSIDGLGALSQVDVSGRIVSSHPTVGEPCQELSVHEKVLDAIERVTISAEKIEIQMSDVVAMGGQDRTLTIPMAAAISVPAPRDHPR